MKQFDELGLSERTLSAVTALKYENPTPVQERAIPLVLEGRDIIAAAKTGTDISVAKRSASEDSILIAGMVCGEEGGGDRRYAARDYRSGFCSD